MTGGREREVVLAVGAHPDDVELGVGGTLAKHRTAGHPVFVLTLTRGEASLPDGQEIGRLEESRRALEELRVAPGCIYTCDLGDTVLPSRIAEIAEAVQRTIQETGATVMYAPAGADEHQDHRATALAVSAATRLRAEPRTILAYETVSARLSKFNPVWTEALSAEEMERKIAALRHHRSQAHKAYMDPDYVLGLARWRALEAGLRTGWAEAFALTRRIRTEGAERHGEPKEARADRRQA